MPPPGAPRANRANASLLPPELAPFSARWPSVLPGWERRMWSAEENRNLFVSQFPDMADVYTGYRHVVQRADAARLAYSACCRSCAHAAPQEP